MNVTHSVNIVGCCLVYSRRFNV